MVQTRDERGNARCQWRWISSTAWAGVQTQFDSLGNVKTRRDELGKLTTYSYADAWVNGSSPAPSASKVTEIVNAAGHVFRYSYDYPSGQVWSYTDPNNAATNYRYNDALERLTDVTLPIGARAFEYLDASRKIVSKQLVESGTWCTRRR